MISRLQGDGALKTLPAAMIVLIVLCDSLVLGKNTMFKNLQDLLNSKDLH